jgi:hypothetical protein
MEPTVSRETSAPSEPVVKDDRPHMPMNMLVDQAARSRDYCENVPDCPGYHRTEYDPDSGVLTLTYSSAEADEYEGPGNVEYTDTTVAFIEVGKVVDITLTLLRMSGRDYHERSAVGQLIAEFLDAASLDEHPDYTPTI